MPVFDKENSPDLIKHFQKLKIALIQGRRKNKESIEEVR
jgi:hypothetical protein